MYFDYELSLPQLVSKVWADYTTAIAQTSDVKEVAQIVMNCQQQGANLKMLIPAFLRALLPLARQIDPEGPSYIADFHDRYHWLSNFAQTGVGHILGPSCAGIRPGDTSYSTLEHAYQAAKSDDEQDRALIHGASTPAQAKRLGRRIHCRADWDSIKLSVMSYLIQQKFQYGSGASGQLLSTRYAVLVEGNTWNDQYWGVCNKMGLNALGLLLMVMRSKLR